MIVGRVTGVDLPLGFELFHDIQKLIVYLRLERKLVLHLIEIIECILHFKALDETRRDVRMNMASEITDEVDCP